MHFGPEPEATHSEESKKTLHKVAIQLLAISHFAKQRSHPKANHSLNKVPAGFSMLPLRHWGGGAGLTPYENSY